MDLSPTLIESIIMLTIGGLCFWLWYLKGKYEEVKDIVHNLQLDLAKNYHGKDEIQVMLDKSLKPLHDLMTELKLEVKQLRDRT
jgi:hypothetical protein